VAGGRLSVPETVEAGGGDGLVPVDEPHQQFVTVEVSRFK
jgi:hypothetical protein